jgi:hypothetical protein
MRIGDFTDSGIDHAIRTVNEITDFIFSMYSWKMNKLDDTGKVDFAFDLLEKMEKIEYIKDAFNSFRTKEKEDRFERKPLTK